jgi:hypothetical protein
MTSRLATCCLLAAATLRAQTVTATLTGTVTDASGSAIPGATISATNLATNVSKTGASSAAGLYSIPYLQPGAYRVSVEAQGFKRTVLDQIELSVDQQARADFKLEVGQVNESITVEATAPLINSENASVGQVIENAQIVNTPLKGRAFYDLVQLSPAVVPKPPRSFIAGARAMPGGLNAPSFQVGGARESSNGYLIDGVSNVDPHFLTPSFLPPVDAIQEFKLQTSAYSAEFGRSAAQINATTRAGGNEFHGSLYEFFRNEKLDAANFFTNLTGQQRAPLRYNQFGGTLGGPVLKNRTFFFLNYDAARVRRGKTTQLSVPVAEQRAGNFSNLGFRNNRPIYDPATTRGTGAAAVRDPFAGNLVPAARVTTFGRRVLDFFPAPNLNTATGNNFSANLSDQSDNDLGIMRIDQRISDKLSLFGRYAISKGVETNLRPVAFDGAFNEVRTQNAAFNAVYSLTPTVLYELRLGYNRPVYLRLQTGAFESDIARDLGLRNLLTDPIGFGVPNVNLTGFSGIGDPGNPTAQVTNVYQLINHVTLIRGAHTIKAGADQRKTNYNDRSDRMVRGTFGFTGELTALPGRAGQTGVSLADLMLGLPLTAAGSNTSLAGNFNGLSHAFFFQDDWKVHSRVTLNLGLRYDLNQRYTDVQNRLSFFDSSFPGGRLLISGTSQAYIPGRGVVDGPATSRTAIAADKNNWGPRIGLAFRPFADNKTAVRLGYGVFFDQIELQDLRTFVRNPPFGEVIELRSDPLANATAPSVLRVAELFPARGTLAARPNVFSPVLTYPDPYYQQWNLGIEREIKGGVRVELTYLGSKGTRLAQRLNLAQVRLDADPARPTPVIGRSAFPLWGTTLRITDPAANSTFHSGYIKLEKRFRGGLSFLNSYTWAKSLDGSNAIDEQPRDIFNRSLDKARSSADLRHRAVFSGSYELPFGKGKAWAGDGALAAIAGGWQTNFNLSMRSGFPFSVVSPGDPCNCNGRAQTGNQVADPWSGAVRTRERWYNTSAFAIPSLGTFGTSGRNILSGPGAVNMNFSLFRQFSIRERFRVQFRVETFNLFNRANFDPPPAQINAPTNGVLTSADDARNLQFGLKVNF